MAENSSTSKIDTNNWYSQLNKYGGVYCIKNTINNKNYIGSSINLYSRFREHINALRFNRHENSYLQASYNKYKEEAFEFIVLAKYERIPDIDFRNFLLMEEQMYLNRLNRTDISLYKKISYNIRPTAWDATGTSITSGARKRISEERLRNPRNTKKCFIYNNKGEKISEYNSVAECCRINNFTPSKLQSACRNNTYYKGLFWSYEENYIFKDLIVNRKLKESITNKVGKRIIIVETGRIYNTLISFCRDYNITQPVAYWALKKNKSIKGINIKLYE